MANAGSHGLPARWDMETDVVVLGSGSAALAAAVAAAEHGAAVAVLERAARFGGTTAISGGIAWVPNNPHMKELGVRDTRDDALTYLRRLTLGRVADDLVTTFVDQGPEVIRLLEAQTPVRYEALAYPDYHPEFPGSKKSGRSMDPYFYDLAALGSYAELVRLPPHNPFGIRVKELEVGPENLDYEALAQRLATKVRGGGVALIGMLLKGCLDREVVLQAQTRGRQLVRVDGAVVGVRAEWEGRDFFVRAANGVVLGTGGFEWNEEMARAFLPGPLPAKASAPGNEGDGQLMAMEVGASLGNMSEAWWMPLVQVHGEEYEGRPFFRISYRERTRPGSIVVNRFGKRFMNEAHNYNDVGKIFLTFDPVKFDYINHPAWVVFDHHYKSRYFVTTVHPKDPAPAWFKRGKTLRELARQINVDPDGLEQTVERFNQFARDGRDLDFQRGESYYDRYYGDRANQPSVTLGVIEAPPFYAIPLFPGTLGTKGGPRTNTKAQVLDVWGKVIPGLYAAGNAMASVMGPAYPGAGGTIGPALTFGYIAGRTAARESRQ